MDRDLIRSSRYCPQCNYITEKTEIVPIHRTVIDCSFCGYTQVKDVQTDEYGIIPQILPDWPVYHYKETTGYGVWCLVSRNGLDVNFGKFSKAFHADEKRAIALGIQINTRLNPEISYVTASAGELGDMRILHGTYQTILRRGQNGN